jgi:hypothetical protein
MGRCVLAALGLLVLVATSGGTAFGDTAPPVPGALWTYSGTTEPVLVVRPSRDVTARF